MMVTSLDDENAMPLMRAEVPGPEADKLVPKARSTAKILYQMYFVLTAAEVVLLMFGGMNLYDALVHSFSTAGTGGFSNRNSSVAFYDSAYIDGVITVFMILFGINFNLYFLLLLKNWKSVLKNEELRAYLGIIAAAVAVITINILSIYENVFHAFRYASFQVASVITTTGFYTADYELWPELSKVVLLTVMFIGACAGSTGGGIKVCRFVILCKSIRQEIRKILHPNVVTMVKINGKKLYELARKGREVERPARKVTIHALTLESREGERDFTIRVRCSKGTYVRTLCHDIGQALGCGGCMSGLRRTMAAGFTLEDAVKLETVQQAQEAEKLLLPVDAYFAGRPMIILKAELEKKVRNGMTVILPQDPGVSGECRVYGESGEFLALGKLTGRKLETVKSFFSV